MASVWDLVASGNELAELNQLNTACITPSPSKCAGETTVAMKLVKYVKVCGSVNIVLSQKKVLIFRCVYTHENI